MPEDAAKDAIRQGRPRAALHPPLRPPEPDHQPGPHHHRQPEQGADHRERLTGIEPEQAQQAKDGRPTSRNWQLSPSMAYTLLS